MITGVISAEFPPLLSQAFGITPAEIASTIKSAEQPQEMGAMFQFLSDYAAISDPATRQLVSDMKLNFIVANMKRRMGNVAVIYKRQASEYTKLSGFIETAKVPKLQVVDKLQKISEEARKLSEFSGQTRADKVAFIDAIIGFEHTSGSIIPIAFGISDYGREDYWPRKLIAFLRIYKQPGMVKEGTAPDTGKPNIIFLPLEQAWKMRAKHAYPGAMEPKRTREAMERLRIEMKKGRFEPIPATQEELRSGILTEGKHRLIVAKELGLKQVPIKIIEPKGREGGQAFWDEVKNLKVVDFEVQHDINPDKPSRDYYHVYDRTFAILENGKKVQISYVIYKGEEGKRAAKATKEFYMRIYGQYMGKPLSEWITYDQLVAGNRYEEYKAQQPKPRFTFIPEAPAPVSIIQPAPKIQSTQEITQQLLSSIHAARSIEELQPILKGIGFMPLPETEKRQVMDMYQNKYSTLAGQRPFGERLPVEEKPKFIGAPSRQELAEAELRRKAEEGKKLRGQVELGGAVSTATRLGLFEPGAMEKAKAEAEARRRLEALGLPSTIHPVIKRLAESPQEVLKFGSKRGSESLEDIVLRRYVQYCPPGTIIDNRNVPKVIERWWVYPPKLRTCVTQVEQKLAAASGVAMVKECVRSPYTRNYIRGYS